MTTPTPAPPFPTLPLRLHRSGRGPNVPESIAFMKNVQGGILSGRQRGKHMALVFLRFNADAATAAAANARAVNRAAADVTCAYKQYQRPADTRETLRSFVLSATGLEACGVGANSPYRPSNLANHDSGGFHPMNTPEVAKILHDDLNDWQPDYLGRIDAAWLLANDDPALLDREVQSIEQDWCPRNGMAVVVQERGAVPSDGKEPFGFADGISMPRFFTVMPPGTLRTQLPEVFLQGPQDHGSSFLVFRKLEQNVFAFRKFRAANGRAAVEKLVGRKESGEPLSRPGLAKRLWNLFSFRGDNDGARCPFSAHIRRLNPRSDLRAEKRLHIVRRGVVYGAPEDLKPGGPGAKEGVGLLFMAYMHDLNVFDMMQGSWSRADKFMGRSDVPPDPLLHGPRPGIARWVTPKGGAYFFVPSLQWLRSVRPDV